METDGVESLTTTAVRYKLTRTVLKNVDDAAGRWQFEGGSVSRINSNGNGQKVANYSSTKRVTFGATDGDGLNAATVTTTFLFLSGGGGGGGGENLTLMGTHNFSSGNQMGSVSAASNAFKSLIGEVYTRNGASDIVQIG